MLEGISPHLLAEMEDVQKTQFEAASPMPEGASSILQRLLSRRPTAASTYEGIAQPHAQERKHYTSNSNSRSFEPGTINRGSSQAQASLWLGANMRQGKP